jgi:hypothetical protein
MESTPVQLESLETNRSQITGRLESVRSNNHDSETAPQSLQPVDGGIAAWRVLIAAFVFEALLWGGIHAPSYTWS